MASEQDIALILLTSSIHLLCIGVFLLVVKTAIWTEGSLILKGITVMVLYVIYAFIVAPGVDPLAESFLGVKKPPPPVMDYSNIILPEKQSIK